MQRLLRHTRQPTWHRHFSLSPVFQTCEPAVAPASLAEVHSIDDFQRLARVLLPKTIYEYISSGSNDEITLREDRAGFRRLALRPRGLRPVNGLTCAVDNFLNTGHSLSLPVFASPAGVHAVAHRDGECATATACGLMGTMFGHSQHATKSIEEVANVAYNTNRWFQCYILRERHRTAGLIRRAIRSGCTGIFVTVDSVRFGFREADARNGFDSLPGLDLANYREHVSDLNQRLPSGPAWQRREYASWDQNTEAIFAEDVDWDDIHWLRRVIDEESVDRHIPLVVKGIMCGSDASTAVETGVDGVMVSTHGGRQLDSTLGAIEALPEVVQAVRKVQPDKKKCAILLDSGVRRGTDVVKALAMGATAVGVGKPIFFALAVGGMQGVVRMLEIFKTETETAMALCGCRTVDDITSDLVIRRTTDKF